MEVGRNVDNEDVKKPVPQSLRITAKEVSDYYTKAEYTAFMKPKSGKEKKMRRKKKEEGRDDGLCVKALHTRHAGAETNRSLRSVMSVTVERNAMYS